MPSSPAAIAEAEGVTYEACVKAAWLITETLNNTFNQLEEFAEVFKQLAKDEELAPVFRDCAGVAWAIDQFTGLQWGQLPYWAGCGRRHGAPSRGGVMLLLRCEDISGRSFELAAGDTEDEATARARAARVASFLSRLGNPLAWRGGRVTVTDRAAHRLLFVARIVAGKRVSP